MIVAIAGGLTTFAMASTPKVTVASSCKTLVGKKKGCKATTSQQAKRQASSVTAPVTQSVTRSVTPSVTSPRYRLTYGFHNLRDPSALVTFLMTVPIQPMDFSHFNAPNGWLSARIGGSSYYQFRPSMWWCHW